MLGNLEARMADLIDNKILKADGTVSITRTENLLIKKYFTIAMFHVPESPLVDIRHLDSEDSLIRKGFKERKIENESPLDYACRTIKVILESECIKDVCEYEDVTYEACNWMTLLYSCYLTISLNIYYALMGLYRPVLKIVF